MAPTKARRRTFTREFELEVVSWHFNNSKNVNKTANKFEIDRRQVRNWIKDEGKIRKQNRKSKAARIGLVRFPLMENQLKEEFLGMRREGKSVKRWWFTAKAKQILKQLHPNEDDTFRFSNRWFEGFCRRNKISLRRKTHAAQKSPAQLRTAISGFHAKVLRQRKRGTYQLRDLGNMD